MRRTFHTLINSVGLSINDIVFKGQHTDRFLHLVFPRRRGEKQVIEIANAFVARGYAVDLLVLKPVGQLVGQVDHRVRVVSLDAGRIIFLCRNSSFICGANDPK